MSAYLRRAFAAWDCVYVCGPEGFWERFRAVLSFQDPGEYSVTIADDWALAPPSGPLLPAGESSLRSALRQDPDCLVVARGEEHGAMLLQAALTGHRVVAGLGASPREALQLLLGEQPALAATQARTLFFDADSLWLYQPEADRFERVAEFRNGAFQDLSQPAEPTPPPPPAPLEPLQAPAEWGPPSPLLPELEAILSPLARLCYAPVFEGGPAVGQFGGSPLLALEEQWPGCGACQQRLHLVCQLDLAHLPCTTPLPAVGWLQLFYCTSEACSHPQAWGPFSHNALVRYLAQGKPSSETAPAPHFESRQITGWLPLTDYPGWEERPQLDDRQRAASHNLEEPAFLEHFCLTDPEDQDRAAAYFRNYPGDKLLGWPAWSQAADYPPCPECQRPMQMLLQINNDGPNGKGPGYESCHGQLFAADGNGHVFICPDHPQQMTFSWSCG